MFKTTISYYEFKTFFLGYEKVMGTFHFANVSGMFLLNIL